MFVIEYIDQYPIQIIVALLVLCFILILIGEIYRKDLYASMNRPYFTVQAFDVDSWSIAHFMLYMAIGFVVPNYPLSFLILGIGWEVLEDVLATDKNTKLVNCLNDKDGLHKKIMCNSPLNGFWIADFDDLLFNMVGYLIGSAIRTSIVGYDISVDIVKK